MANANGDDGEQQHERDYLSLSQLLTAERLGSYLHWSGGDLQAAFALYEWNMSASAAVMHRRHARRRVARDKTAVALRCVGHRSNEIRAMSRLLPENLDASRLTRSDGIKRSERRHDCRGAFCAGQSTTRQKAASRGASNHHHTLSPEVGVRIPTGAPDIKAADQPHDLRLCAFLGRVAASPRRRLANGRPIGSPWRTVWLAWTSRRCADRLQRSSSGRASWSGCLAESFTT